MVVGTPGAAGAQAAEAGRVLPAGSWVGAPVPSGPWLASTAGEIGFVSAGAGLFVLSKLLPPPEVPTCGPCDRAQVPAFDRWAISDQHPGIQLAGRAFAGAFTVYSWADLSRDGQAGASHIRASAETALLAGSVALVLKEVFHRRRPVWFNRPMIGESLPRVRESLRSFPSGDTGIAVGFAASYLLSRGRRLDPWQGVLAVGAAGVAGASRVAGGAHFPSDVLGGIAIGVGSAFLVHAALF
jgi:membrane-associated phospholipid phosphatase